MTRKKLKKIPVIVIEEGPANDLYLVLDGLLTGGTHLAGRAFESIKNEGEEMARAAAGAKLSSAKRDELLPGRDQLASILTRIESVVNSEPALLTTAEVVAKYFREIKPLEIGNSSRRAKRSKRSTNSEDSVANDAYYFMLGLFGLAHNAIKQSEEDIASAVLVSADTSAATKKPDDKRSKSPRAKPSRPRSNLLR